MASVMAHPKVSRYSLGRRGQKAIPKINLCVITAFAAYRHDGIGTGFDFLLTALLRCASAGPVAGMKRIDGTDNRTAE